MQCNQIYSFEAKTDLWTPIRAPWHASFPDDKIKKITEKLNGFAGQKRTIVLCSFENRYSRLGGLGAVMQILPDALAKSGEKVLFITPLHRNIPAVADALKLGKLVPEFSRIICQLGNWKGNLSCYRDVESETPAYYCSVKGFFTSRNTPYEYSEKDLLVADASVFCVVVPFLLKKLGLRENCVISAHDWETALVSISSKLAMVEGILGAVKTVLTLHNVYDSSIPEGMLKDFFGLPESGKTVLQTTIPLFDAPILTVSDPFSWELRNDPFQSQVFAGHLQKEFSVNPPIAVEQGPFLRKKNISASLKKAIESAQSGNFDPLLKLKQRWRRVALSTIGSIAKKQCIGKLETNSLTNDVPLLFMSGRYEPMQKGFDVVFNAFRDIPPGKIKLVCCPSTFDGENGKAQRFFSQIAHEHMGDLLIISGLLLPQIYSTILQGASFMITPSFFEPFGSVSESMAIGTPVIARATGGLISQIDSLEPFHIPEYYRDFLNPSCSSNAAPDGILYREAYKARNDVEYADEWRAILATELETRMQINLYREMVDVTTRTLLFVTEIFRDQAIYGNLIMNGMIKTGKMSWSGCIRKYRRIFDIMQRNPL